MQGFIHLLLEAYVSEHLGPQYVVEIRHMAGVSGAPVVTQQYPDQVTLKLVEAIASLQRTDPDDVLYHFGVYFMNAPLMERNYLAYFQGHRDARDFLKNVTAIHRTLQTGLRDAHMPELRYIDHSSDLLEIIYTSPRRLCSFLRGILEGVGVRFNTPLEVREMECQHRGARACLMLVSFPAARPSSPLLGDPLRSKTPGSGLSRDSGPGVFSAPLPGYPAGPTERSSSLGEQPLQGSPRKRDFEEDVLVLQALSGFLPSQRLYQSTAQRPLPQALSLFEILQHLQASAVSAEWARFSLIQRSLTRLAIQGFVEVKTDAHTHEPGAKTSSVPGAGGGVLATQRYHITSTGQTWLYEQLRML